jgi:4-amino-4-deoxy-L-arabinose transferase-like glycosyltransferase
MMFMNPSTSTNRATIARGLHRCFVCGLAVVIAAYIVFMSLRAWIEQDELEAIHAAWKILHGELIYVDFFEHHHPLLYAYLAPVIALCGERAATVLACRIAVLPFFFGTVAATWLLAGRLFDKRTAQIAAACLLLSWPFLFFGTEVRPDVPQVFFGMLGLVLLYPRPTDETSGPPGERQAGDLPQVGLRRFLLSGVCLGVSFLFLQKAVFYVVAAALIVLVRIARRETGWGSIFALWGGIAIALLPFGMWLLAKGMVREYFFLNWTLNACCTDRFSPWPNAFSFVETQPAVCAFALFAFVALLRDRRHIELALATCVLACLPLLAPAPYIYYWLCVVPPLSIYAAHGLVRVLGRRPVVLAAILAGSAVAPLIVNIVVGEQTNVEQLARFSYVLEVAGPSDFVYDGDIWFNVFRKDLDYFWFSLGKNAHMLETYRSLRPYHLDLYDRIDKLKPKVISTFMIDNLNDPRIREHYAPADRCDCLYIHLYERTR